MLMEYVESLNIPLGTNYLNARNHVESVKEEDDKILSLGMPMHPKEIGRASCRERVYVLV